MVTHRRRRLAHLTKAQLSARSRQGWITRRLARTAAQRKHDKAVYNEGLKRRMVREGRCRSCCRKREPSRRTFRQCVRCAKASAARNRRYARHWIPRSQMRTAA